MRYVLRSHSVWPYFIDRNCPACLLYEGPDYRISAWRISTMSTTEATVYEHSGQLGSGAILVPVGALIATLILSVAYAYISVYSPIAGYISLLFVLGFGFGIAAATAYIGSYAKCRNPAFLRRVGFAAGLIGLYVSWAVFEYALLKRYDETFTVGLFDIVLAPAGAWELAKAINEEGWYSISGFTPSGVVLWIFWGIEAAAIIGIPAIFSTMAINDKVFCEQCDHWVPSSKKVIRLAVPSDAAPVTHLQAGEIEPLEALPSVSANTTPHLHVDVKACSTCKKTAAYQVNAVELEPDKDGKIKEKKTALTELLMMKPDALSRLQALADRPAE